MRQLWEPVESNETIKLSIIREGNTKPRTFNVRAVEVFPHTLIFWIVESGGVIVADRGGDTSFSMYAPGGVHATELE